MGVLERKPGGGGLGTIAPTRSCPLSKASFLSVPGAVPKLDSLVGAAFLALVCGVRPVTSACMTPQHSRARGNRTAGGVLGCGTGITKHVSRQA